MRLLFLGAGASYGSEDRNTHNLPPLGNNLFNALLEHNPNLWLKASQTFDSKSSFEDGWYLFRTQVLQNDFVPLMKYLQDMGKYFFKFSPCSENLYVKLAKRIKASWKEGDGAIASLNYDKLFQTAFVNQQIDYVDFIAPHGCCNVVANLGDLISFDTERTRIAMLSPTFSKANTQVTFCPDEYEDLLSQNYIPLMAYYEKDKGIDINAEYLEYHKTAFKQRVKASSTIVMIGVAFIEHDLHIWQPISESNAKILYINPGKMDNDRFELWAKQKGLNYSILPKTFYEAFDDICLALNLTSK